MYCTYAVTGSRTRWQPIFICHDCSTAENEENQCICDACSEQCHKGHNVEYIGMGPSYCDCGKSGSCNIIEASLRKARELRCCEIVEQLDQSIGDETPPLLDPQISRITDLEDTKTCERLKEQATQLVKLSRDTHWLDFNESSDELCELEVLALQIFKWHTTARELNGMAGAEWWVQVKDLASDAAAVDLHYDKDEKLAESFGLGNFPLISTVSYLTDNGYPTLVLPHCYDESEEEDMDSMLVSQPRLGKHLLFDGRLLHGAPSHPALLREELGNNSTTLKGYRVTFLVNLWKGTQPTGVKRLSSDIRDTLLRTSTINNSKEIHELQEIVMEQEDIPSITLLSEDDLPVDKRVRIILPFVSEGATWIDDDDDDEPNLVLMTFACPKHNSDTVNVEFGPGMQSYLEYLEDESDQDEIYEPIPHAEDYV